MEHLLLKAAVTPTTDEGVFEAVISSAAVDREKDVVSPHGMVRALQKWVPKGKKIPLAWAHSGAPNEQIGYIDPESAHVVGDEVLAKGWIDQSVDAGAHAWRLAKMGTLGFSFGYLIPDGGATRRKGGGLNINELDVFEITATPTPVQNDTRVVGWKSLPSDADQRERAAAIERDLEHKHVQDTESTLGDPEPEPEPDPEPEPEPAQKAVPSDADQRRRARTIERDLALKQVQDTEDTLDSPDEPASSTTILESMVTQAQEFIDTDPEDDDVAIMEQILGLLHQLQAEEEEDAEMAADMAADMPAKAVKPEPRDLGPKTAALLRVPFEEMDGLADGSLKAVWSTAFVNGLPDTAFLFVESGGTKDSDGKTVPRTLRHFPYKDDAGAIDHAHLVNALSRIPQADFLSQAQKDSLTAKARGIMDKQKPMADMGAASKDASKSVDATDRGRTTARSADLLRRQADRLELEHASAGESLRTPPRQKQAPTPTPELSLEELRQRMREEMLTALSGVEDTP